MSSSATARESQVLTNFGVPKPAIRCHIGRGLCTLEIADRLCLSPHMVRACIDGSFERFGDSSRGDLVARIFAEHYAEPPRYAHSPTSFAGPTMGKPWRLPREA